MMACAPALVDAHGRTISYLRISVTDRCDLRCRYCMAEHMSFLPRNRLLSLEEIAVIGERCVARGISKIRLTGGEPLVRRGIDELAARLGSLIGHGLEELTFTTNGVRLPLHADALARAGVRRVNVSMDTLDPDVFRHITRHGDVEQVKAGIAAAQAAGIAVKVNAVALAGWNDQSIPELLGWCGERGIDLTLIETMPMGEIDEDRTDRFVPLGRVFDDLATRFTLSRDTHRSGGPARYWRVGEFGTRLGLISPLTANFCEGCNRIRLTTEGKIYMCLGQDDHVDLRAALREEGPDALDPLLDRAMRLKPAGHDFRIGAGEAPAVARHMNVTGG